MDVAQSAGNEEEGEVESPPSLNSTLETVFEPTQLAKKLGSISDKSEELEMSDAEINLDSEVEHLKISTLVKGQRKKRGRKNMVGVNVAELAGNDGEEQSVVVSGSDKVDQQGQDQGAADVEQSGNEEEEESEFPLSVDNSLELVFGPGATQLANELGSFSDKREEPKMGDTEQRSESEVELVNDDTPAKDHRKKRARNNIKFGDIDSIKGIQDNSGVSSEGENTEVASKEVKKPRLGEECEEENANNSEELAEENKDHTKGSEEKDKIFKVLLDMHEDVPLEDPGPNIESMDRAEGATGATQ